MSVAGGLHLAIERIERVRGRALQIFTRNQRQWRAVPVSAAERELFARARAQWGGWPTAVHGSYLINLASAREEVREKSVLALAAELERTAALAIPYLVMHPGSHGGDGAERGLARIAANLDRAFEMAAGAEGVVILLENTAGQGHDLGANFDEIRAILAQSRFAGRLGVCIDTCHLFAAGYDLASRPGYERTMNECASTIGLEKVRFFHLNDSLRELGSRIDRHTHIGKGHIGLKGFRHLLRDPRFAGHPMVLETPKGRDLAEDMENLRVLRKLMNL